MKRKLILVLIVLMGVFLLSGCSNDGDSLNDETEITAVVEDFENDLNILATAASSSDKYQQVDAGWDADKKIRLNVYGISIEKITLEKFKEVFQSELNFGYFGLENIVIKNKSSNRAEVVAEVILNDPEAPIIQNEGNSFFVDIYIEKMNDKWYIDEFILRVNEELVLSSSEESIFGGAAEVKYPVGDSLFSGWSKKSGIFQFDFITNYYMRLDGDQPLFYSSIMSSSAFIIDRGNIITTKNELNDIANLNSQREQIEKISNEILNELYDNTFTISIDPVSYKEITKGVTGNDLIYDIDKMKIEIPAPAFIETDGENNVEEIYANYKMKIVYRLVGETLYLAAYAAPELYYNQEFADQLISSFKIYQG